MTRCAATLPFMLLLFLSLSACTISGNQQERHQIPADYEIRDVRVLPQDIRAYAPNWRDPSLGDSCGDYYLSEFKRRYYSPWTDKSYKTDIVESVATMKKFAEKEWYGENRRRVTASQREELLRNCDIERHPSMSRPAIITTSTAMRVLPTVKPFFETADGFPFDALQNTGLKLNEPIRVLHRSRDGLWVFVETADTSGWVESRNVGYVDKNFAAGWMGKEQVVLVKDLALIRDEAGNAFHEGQLGAICPLTGETGGDYEILVAGNDGRLSGSEMKAKVSKEAAGRFPLRLDRESIALVGNELINKPYGWGELLKNRDCSAMIRDFYLPFGIWLPRGSYNQIHSGRIISLAGLESSEKERQIAETGLPFLTLVYLKGHIMLYVGKMNGNAVVLHNIWGIRVRDGKGGEYKQVIGKSIVSTLNPGSELDLAEGSILERVSSMLILGNGCIPAGP